MSDPQDTQRQNFLEFCKTKQFPLYFSAFPSAAIRVDSGALVSSPIGPPPFCRLMPVDATDVNTKYYLMCDGLYASIKNIVWNSSDCIAVTDSTDIAFQFTVVFQSTTVMALVAYDQVFPDPRAPSGPFYSLCHRWSGPQSALLMEPELDFGGFTSSIIIPTDGTDVADWTRLLNQWHRFFARALFPLIYSDRDKCTLSLSGSYLTPGGFGHFRFIAVDPSDYTKGYRVLANHSNYVAGIGTYGNSDCFNTTTDINQASVWRFVLMSQEDRTFMLQQGIGNVLTRPWDMYSNGLYGRGVTLAAAPGDNGFGGVQQIFQMPFYAFRQMRMGNVSTQAHFYFSSGGKHLYANGTTLAWGDVDDDSATIVLTLPSPTSLHVGYHISVGGKWITSAAANAPITLAASMDQAAHFCPIFDDDTDLELWLYDTNLALAVVNGQPVFVDLEDPTAIAPAWSVALELDPNHPTYEMGALANATTSDPATKTLATTVYLKDLVPVLQQTKAGKYGTMWNYSFDNIIAPDDWLLASPGHMFAAYAYIPKRIVDATNTTFPLKTAGGNTGPAIALLQSSVNAVGGTPQAYYAGHSYFLYEQIYQLIISGNEFIDVSGLLRPVKPGDSEGTPTGEFLAALRNALTYLSTKTSAPSVVIRLLFGEPGGYPGDFVKGYRAAGDVLMDLTRDIAAMTTSRMTIYIAYAGTTVTWNHAKIVAVDGQRAIVGGHNLWQHAYLGDYPVFDISMKLSGHATFDAHNYAEDRWVKVIQAGVFHEADAASFDASLPAGSRIVKGSASLPVARLFNIFLDEVAHPTYRDHGTGAPILSIGRGWEESAGAAASDITFPQLIRLAQREVYISLQTLGFNGYNEMSPAPLPWTNWPEDFMNAIADAVTRNVKVYIFISSETSGAYQGNPPAEVMAQIQGRIKDHTPSAVVSLLQANLFVQAFPNIATKWVPTNVPGIGNHSKLIMVDKLAYSIGSQNWYPTSPATLAEFTYVVEDATTATQLYTNIFQPMMGWAVAAVAPPTPAAPPDRWTITITGLACAHPSSDTDDGTSRSADDMYLWLNGSRLFPFDSRYTSMDAFETLSFTITLDVFTSDDSPYEIHVYDHDWLSSDDDLGYWSLHPDIVLIGCDANGFYFPHPMKLRDLQPDQVYFISMTQSNGADYRLHLKYSVASAPNGLTPSPVP